MALATKTRLEDMFGTVGEAMTSDVLILEADTPADVALRQLQHAGVSGTTVTRAGQVAGVITVRDLVTPMALPPPALGTGGRSYPSSTCWSACALRTS